MKVSNAWFYIFIVFGSMITFLTVMWMINPLIVGLLFVGSSVYGVYEIKRAKIIKNEKEFS